MDTQTQLYYTTHAAAILQQDDRAGQGIEQYFPLAFTQGIRVLDIGMGSGRNMAKLAKMGIDVYGVDPCEELRHALLARYPTWHEKIATAALPHLDLPFGEQFDGVVCSAVLMHLPREDIFDSVFAIRSILKVNGRLLLSIPLHRPDLDASHRDEHGRLFTPLQPDYVQLLFERLGFHLSGKWESKDSLGRERYTWSVLLFDLRSSETIRPLDQIEGILNRDKKTATYKLALFRALADIAVTEMEQARWDATGAVSIPLDLVCERWITYYWPLFASQTFIPQNRGETPASKKPIAFRAALTALIRHYEKSGGLTSFVLDSKHQRLSQAAQQLLSTASTKIRRAIVEGPVHYAGGSLETGRVFRARNGRIEMDAALWRELSLLGHWIHDAVILRWAELTEELSKGTIRTSAVIDALLTNPIPERDVRDARQIYTEHARECVWSGRSIEKAFDVDHVIPFSLWRNNDLWNLLPAHPQVNRDKRDRLPTRSLLFTRKDSMVEYWRLLRQEYPARFDLEAARIMGVQAFPDIWENKVFQAVTESAEITALQRGCERWQPE